MANLNPSIEDITHSISDLVDQFLEVARNGGNEPPGSETRQADLMYELDSLVSDFLDENQLDANEFSSIEQQVLNSIAEDLINEETETNALEMDQDELGNFDAGSVFSALDMTLMEASVEAPSSSFGVDAMDG
ncbi:hypothetical protein [Synechococcus sp. KORDI-52]|uniref:hypothetical protein n=1 Tax=Synechococcus sp. KORDI-52 TaxID=585425 RepID=UPI0012EBDA29|nr:hypothetical protein [Synechococcus sp. KORDI-52]